MVLARLVHCIVCMDDETVNRAPAPAPHTLQRGICSARSAMRLSWISLLPA